MPNVGAHQRTHFASADQEIEITRHVISTPRKAARGVSSTRITLGMLRGIVRGGSQSDPGPINE